ncbi:MAG: ice-binding family protein [Nitrosotalea sp.]
MTRNNIKNYFVMFVLIISATSIAQSNAFAASVPNLGAADNFAVLAGSTITCTGAGAIIGDIGVSPGTAIVLGATPCTVSGTINPGNPLAAHAHADASTAFTNLNAAACTVNEPSVADIGGLTLGPGVYCFPSSAAITGNLTLSGNGVYIFKIGSTLTTAAGPGASNVILTNGASSSNVFWAVGSSATLGTDSVLQGTIIAFTSITATTNAAVDGRLLAINGAVTLDTNKISVVGTDNGGNGGNGTGDNGKGDNGKGDNGKGEHDEGHHDKDHHNKDAKSDKN